MHINPTRTRLTMHNNTNAIPVGKVMLNVERGSKKHYLRFFVMKSPVMPILGKSTCIGMRLIKFLDCDVIHTVTEATHRASDLPSIEQTLSGPVLSQYTDVFDGLGELPGEYTIQIKPNTMPVVNPPCRLPVALRGVVKAELDAMADKQIITPVTGPTKWVSVW